MNKRILIPLIAVALVIGALYAWREYERTPQGAAELRTDIAIGAPELLAAFTSDEAAANARFNDRVVEVSGKVASIKAAGGGLINVVLDTGDPLSGVVCEFDSVGAPVWKEGDMVTVKGICAGFNLDVLLQRCADAGK